MRILLVEHNPNSGLHLSRLLTSLGHQVATARTARETVALYLKEPFSLVMVDLGRDHYGGLELCRQIRKANVAGYVHVMVIAAPDQASLRRYAETAGADDFLLAPLCEDTLREHLSVAVAFISIYQNLDVLHGMVPICSRCKKVERRKGVWQVMESSTAGQNYLQFTETLCPQCQAMSIAEAALSYRPIQFEVSHPN